MKKIIEITPYLFGDHLVIALSKDWIDIFHDIPKFKVCIDNNGQLIIEGPIIKDKIKYKKINKYILKRGCTT